VYHAAARADIGKCLTNWGQSESDKEFIGSATVSIGDAAQKAPIKNQA